uniref:Transgelin n=1 Tax=Parascaris univalens TaxID=6257 RepID=A0A915BCI0_PARUN
MRVRDPSPISFSYDLMRQYRRTDVRLGDLTWSALKESFYSIVFERLYKIINEETLIQQYFLLSQFLFLSLYFSI